MSEYTSTREGFQRAMQWSLEGKPEEANLYAEATSVPTFHQIMNGNRIEYAQYVAGIAEWRGKTTSYKPVVHEFLRDGNQRAARMTGTIDIEGTQSYFESFMFITVNEEGKMESLVERSVWGAVGKAPEHGTDP